MKWIILSGFNFSILNDGAMILPASVDDAGFRHDLIQMWTVFQWNFFPQIRVPAAVLASSGLLHVELVVRR